MLPYKNLIGLIFAENMPQNSIRYYIYPHGQY